MNLIQRARLAAAKWIAPAPPSEELRPAKSESQKMMFGADFVGGLPLTKFGDYATYLKASAGKVWAHWKAADLVSEQLRSIPTVIVRGKREVKPPADLAALLKVANPEMTFDELKYLTGMHLRLTGNGFWYKADARENGQRPKALYPMNPKRVEIVPAESGAVAGYTLAVGAGGKKIPFTPDEVIHFRRWHPNSDFWGLGESEAGEALLQEQINQGDWTSNFWKNGAAPAGILTETSDSGVNQKDFDRLKADFKREYGGRENSGKLAFLTGKWEHMQIGLSMEDLESIEGQRWGVEQIFMLHGVPLSIAGVKEAANYATAQTDEFRFRKYCIRPAVNMLAATINSDLIADWGDGLELRWNVSTLENVEAVMLGAGPAFDRGILSPNEVRAMMGLDKVEDDPLMDARYVLQSYVPLEMAGEPQADIATTMRAESIAQRAIALNGRSHANLPPARV